MSFFRVKLAQRDKLNSIVGDITVTSRLCRAQNASKVTAAQLSPVEDEVAVQTGRLSSTATKQPASHGFLSSCRPVGDGFERHHARGSSHSGRLASVGTC